MRMVEIALLTLSWLLFTAPVLAAGAADATGIVTGTVNHASVKKYPTVVYIEDIPDAKFSPPAARAVMDQRGKVFSPRVLPVVVGTTVEFLNSDNFDHNVFSPDGEEYDLGKWAKGEKRTYTFDQAGVYTQLCRVHPEMVAYVVVLKTPYFAIADEEGNFSISGLPAGTWTVKTWNERLRPKQLWEAFTTVNVSDEQVANIEITF